MNAEAKTGGRLRVLIVDSEHGLRETLTELLRSLGHVTTSVSDTGKALAQLEPGLFDLMLVSCSSIDFEGSHANLLRETEGRALARFARANDPRLRIILLAAPDQRRLNLAPSSGDIDVVVGKPFTSWDVEKALAMLFGRPTDSGTRRNSN